ncbi:vomeronasal type-1 receptor 4-like [Sarcophilus harrisii]|uniref:Vomeronasal type-1 receptor n=1 Tax=Sarcophilus harrisii TaxID=9305 RepID=G3VS46_SARHA|nr:vomeronasal type-1 receptor 4-like [Sarcophilus harrisii]
MISHYEIFRILYLNQIIIGVLGNSFLIFLYSFNLITNQKIKPIILILIHLLFTNIIFLLFRGIPKIIEFWSLNYFVDYTASKIISYLQRVTRGLSLCSSCLLSVFQAITISPSSSRWAEIKAKVPKYVLACSLLCWICNLLMDLVVPVYGADSSNTTYSNKRWQIGFSALDLYPTKTLLFLIWKFVYDFMFVGLMAITNGYMTFVFYRHHQKIQNIQVTSLFHRSSPEVQATKTILLLASTFVIFNLVSSTFMIYMTFTKVVSSVMLNVSAFLSLCFPTISPFILLKCDSKITRSCCIYRGINKLSLNPKLKP